MDEDYIIQKREEVKKHIWRNFFSNYSRTIVQIIVSFFSFRLLFQYLGSEYFGFWVLVWSLIGYGKFFDIGLGYTVQKYVAQLSTKSDWKELSRVINTVFYVYVAIAFFIIILISIFADNIVSSLQISSDNKNLFVSLFIYFFVWSAISYPLGIFQEVLAGQQRIMVYNNIVTIGTIGNFLGILLILYFGGGLFWLFTSGLFFLTCVSLASGYFGLRVLPLKTFNPRYFSLQTLKKISGFSFFSYVNIISNTLIMNSDRLIISIMINISALPFYQAGVKLGELFTNLTNQLSDTLSPATAHLHAAEDEKGLIKLIFKGMYYTLLIATPVYLIGSFYMISVLRFLTGAQEIPKVAMWTAEILLLWNYITLITNRTLKTVFFMSGKEKLVTMTNVFEAVLSLILMIGLTAYFKTYLTVALGLLIPSLITGVVIIWPLAAKYAKMTKFALFKEVYLRIWVILIPLLLFLVTTRLVYSFPYRKNLYIFLFFLLTSFLIGALLVWFWGLNPSDRKKIRTLLSSKFKRNQK